MELILKKVEDIDMHGALVAAMGLWIRSEDYATRTLENFELYASTPIFQGNAVVAIDERDRALGIATYAFFDDYRVSKYLRKMDLTPEDWNSGSHFWLIDVIAPGVGSEMALALRKSLKGIDVSWWRRKKDVVGTRSAKVLENAHG